MKASLFILAILLFRSSSQPFAKFYDRITFDGNSSSFSTLNLISRRHTDYDKAIRSNHLPIYCFTASRYLAEHHLRGPTHAFADVCACPL